MKLFYICSHRRVLEHLSQKYHCCNETDMVVVGSCGCVHVCGPLSHSGFAGLSLCVQRGGVAAAKVGPGSTLPLGPAQSAMLMVCTSVGGHTYTTVSLLSLQEEG